jgi:hypothetical protein
MERMLEGRLAPEGGAGEVAHAQAPQASAASSSAPASAYHSGLVRATSTLALCTLLFWKPRVSEGSKCMLLGMFAGDDAADPRDRYDRCDPDR